MRSRLLLVLGCLAILAMAVAGCGSSSAGSKVDPTVLSELSYFPPSSPLIFSVATDPNSPGVKHAQALENQFPVAAFGQAALNNKLQQLGINYTTDVRPLFGNPLMVGAMGSTLSGPASNQIVAVWVTKDASKLKALLQKLTPLHQNGTHDGATLYSTGGSTALAVDGATVLAAGSPSLLNEALDRHARGGGLGADQYTRETAGLPRNTLAQVFGSLSGVLSQPRAVKARAVPWVAALRGYGATVDAAAQGLTVRYHLDTTGAKLSTSQLPFAGGSATPSLASAAMIAAGIHDPAQIFSFAESAEQATNPAGYQRFLARQSALRAKTGVDITSLVKLLTGDLILGSDTHTTVGRVGVSDPAAAKQDLAKLASTPNGLFSRGEKVTKLPGGFYAIHERKQTIVLGVIGNQLAAGNVSPQQLRAAAAAPATPAQGAQGTVAYRIDLNGLLRRKLHHAPSQVVQSLLNQLGDITGWNASSTSGIDGSASLTIR